MKIEIKHVERVSMVPKDKKDPNGEQVSTFEATAELAGVVAKGRGSSKEDAEAAAQKAVAAAFAKGTVVDVAEPPKAPKPAA